MQKVLVLGAGMVAGPLIRDLLEHGLEVTVTSLDLTAAKELIAGHPCGHPLLLDIEENDKVAKLVADSDVVVSLLPFMFHPRIAKFCLHHGRHLVTASYVSPEMAALHDEAQAKDLLFLNEIGLDPGIDHMSAMKIIDSVKNQGGEILHFRSYCGGLPAPEANDNPFGYKFSWAPRGVLMASRNDASYRLDGHIVHTPGEDLFRDMHLLRVPGAGDFEAYPNRDSLQYRDIYGLGESARTIFRATLRNLGWCDTLYSFSRVGLLDTKARPGRGMTCAAYLAGLLGVEPDADLPRVAAAKLGIPAGSLPLHNMQWLGLFSDRPVGHDEIAPLDLVGDIMLEKLVYGPRERDMVVLYHEFKAALPAKDSYRKITSTLIACGTPGGDSAMSRTVSLPAAIAVRLMLDGRIPQRGVVRPVHPEIYNPVLAELAALGIDCQEKTMLLET